jgi:deazaflavin-dependent oxidoreductase (nitroreductase family)
MNPGDNSSLDPNVHEARIRAMSADHLHRYLASDGEDGFLIGEWPALLLTSIGRRSGKSRTTPLIFGEDEGRQVVVASFAGLDRHPSWYLNLSADPEVEVQVRGERFAARAQTAAGEERERLWQLMTGVYPLYAEYATATAREIPVVVLERA